MSERGLELKLIRWLLVGLLLLAAGLVWHDLDLREVLGRDENATVTKLDQPDLRAVLDVTYMKVTGEPGNMQPLYFLVQHLLWPLIVRYAFALRFLTSLFGILTVLLTYKLGEVLFHRPSPSAGRWAGLLAALLTALLPLHVRYAQTARPYALLAALSLASAYFLLRALDSRRAVHWAGFVLAATLNFYNHYNALFVLAAEGLFAAGVWLADLLVSRRGRLLGPLLGFGALGLLCAPGLIQLLTLPWVGNGGGEGPAQPMVELTIPFFRHFLYMSGLRTLTIQNLIFALSLLGLSATLYHRLWRTALFALLWLGLPFAILALLRSPRPFEERYVIFVTPLLLLLIAFGVVALGRAVGERARRRNAGWLGRGLAAGLALVLILIFAAALPVYYANSRAADRLALAAQVVERHAWPGDVVVVSPRIFLRPLQAAGVEVLYLNTHLSDEELDGLLAGAQRMWLLYSSYLPPEELQEPLDRWVQAQGDLFVRVPVKSITALAYAAPAPADREAELLDRAAMLAELAADSGGKYEAWQRYDALAQAYEALADYYAGRGETALADDYRRKADEARAEAP